MNKLKRRIIDISYKNKLSHLGSCLSAVDIIDKIFKTKNPDEKFVLSSGHAGLALYVVLEKYQGINAKELLETCGIHPDRLHPAIDCSTGSLGQGLPIAVGMALADRSKNVYCLISDGECAEGSIWESLAIISRERLTNLKIYVNMNGWGAYHRIYKNQLIKQLEAFRKLAPRTFIYIEETDFNEFPFLQGQDAHYHVLTEGEYEKTR